MPDTSTTTPTTSKQSLTSKYHLIQLIVDPYWDKLSHTRVINLVGALTGSILMFWLTLTGNMSEGYLGLYLTAVGLTAVGMKAMDSRDSSSRSSGPSGPSN